MRYCERPAGTTVFRNVLISGLYEIVCSIEISPEKVLRELFYWSCRQRMNDMLHKICCGYIAS
jgi:hypothetical protein